jgi:acetyltransferase-like isoleucine patch superfamily enzyme
MANTKGVAGSAGNSPVSAGRFTYGHQRLRVKQWGEGAALRIGSFCSIAEEITVFLGGNHRTDWISTYPFGHVLVDELGGTGITGHPATRGDVVIGNDVWIAYGATLMSGVTIADGAVIGINATVVKDVAPYEIVGGNPAVHIKFRFDEAIRTRLLALRWWELPVEDIRQITQDLCSEPTADLLDALIKRYRG